MHPDFMDLLSSLNESNVKYLVVGGYAVAYHAQPRATKDLDILVKPDPDNAAALLQALTAFGAPITGFTAADLIERGKFLRFGQPPIAVDILPEIDGIDFDKAWQRRITVSLDPTTDLVATLISAEDLIASKLAAGRPQDLADVDAVRKARAAMPAKSKKARARKTKKPASRRR